MRKLFRSLLVMVLDLMLLTSNFIVIHAEEVTPSAGTISTDTTWISGNLSGDVNILDNVTLTIKGKVTIDNDVKIIGGTNSTIKRDSSYKDDLFYVNENRKFNLKNIIIDGNYIDAIASIIHALDYTVVSLDNVVVSKCKTTSNGSVLYLDKLATGIINNSNFTENSATKNGGVIFGNRYNSLNSKLIIDSSIFTNNKAGQSGGAIYLTTKNKLEISNSDFEYNKADYGGSIATDAYTEISNTQFSNDEANIVGNSIYIFPHIVDGDEYNTAGLSISNNSKLLDVINGNDIISTSGLLELNDSTINGPVKCEYSIVNNTNIDIPTAYQDAYDSVASSFNTSILINSAEEFISKISDNADLINKIHSLSKIGLVSYDTVNFKLNDNLDFSAIDTTGLTTYIDTFTSSIDGNNKTIKGLKIPLFDEYNGIAPGYDYQKFDNYIEDDSELIYPIYVKDLNIIDSSIDGQSTIANWADCISFINVNLNKITINSTSTAGGLVDTGFGIVNNCDFNNLIINASGSCGGIANNALRSDFNSWIVKDSNVSGQINTTNGDVGGYFGRNDFYWLSYIYGWGCLGEYDDDLIPLSVNIQDCICDVDINITENSNVNAAGFVGSLNTLTIINNSTYAGDIKLPDGYNHKAYIGGLSGQMDSGLWIFGSGLINTNNKVTGTLPTKDEDIYSGKLVGRTTSANTNFTGTNEEMQESFGYIAAIRLVDCKGEYIFNDSLNYLLMTQNCDIDKITINGKVSCLTTITDTLEPLDGIIKMYVPTTVPEIIADEVGIGFMTQWDTGHGPITNIDSAIYIDVKNNLKSSSLIYTDNYGSGYYPFGYLCDLRGGYIPDGEYIEPIRIDRYINGFLTPKRDGYLFAGWYKEDTFVNKVDKPDIKTTTSKTNFNYFARWYCEDHSDFIAENIDVPGEHICPNCDGFKFIAPEACSNNNHELTSLGLEVEPSCTTTGIEKKECSHCNKIITYELPTLGHDELDPVLHDDGYYYVYCNRCGDLIRKYTIHEEPIPEPTPTPHYVVPKTGVQ